MTHTITMRLLWHGVCMTKRNPNLIEANYQKTLHELQVNKIELEAQNEALIAIQEQLLASEHSYSYLYDYSPVGYISIGDNDIILRANLTVCLLLNITKEKIVGSTLADHINPQDQDIYYFYRRKNNPSCELRLKRIEDGTIWVRLISRILRNGSEMEYLTIISDISNYKRVEEAKQEAKPLLTMLRSSVSVETPHSIA